MTPSMMLSAIKQKYRQRPDADRLIHDLEAAFSLGHRYGLERAACVVDQCNKEGPYNAIGAAARIRALPVVEINPVATVDKDFV